MKVKAERWKEDRAKESARLVFTIDLSSSDLFLFLSFSLSLSLSLSLFCPVLFPSLSFNLHRNVWLYIQVYM